MTLQELKTGLFGYQKAGVYQYITELEEQFSAQMLEREKRIQQYEGRIAELEQHLKTLQAREREASPAGWRIRTGRWRAMTSSYDSCGSCFMTCCWRWTARRSNWRATWSQPRLRAGTETCRCSGANTHRKRDRREARWKSRG